MFLMHSIAYYLDNYFGPSFGLRSHKYHYGGNGYVQQKWAVVSSF